MSDPFNPWLSRPTTPPATEAAPIADVPKTFGPVAPQRGIPAPDRVDQLPIYNRNTTAALWWVGAHGGAGESTGATGLFEALVRAVGDRHHGLDDARRIIDYLRSHDEHAVLPDGFEELWSEIWSAHHELTNAHI